MSLDRTLNAIEQALGEADGPTGGQGAIIQWLSIWRPSPQKRTYLEQHALYLIEPVEVIQGIIKGPDEPIAPLNTSPR